jgi:hypothetical protein
VRRQPFGVEEFVNFQAPNYPTHLSLRPQQGDK